MNIRLFYHSLISDWNHGNAHFLRGIASELADRGHDVLVYEPEDSWSVRQLLAEHGPGPVRRFHSVYPRLRSIRYSPEALDLDAALGDADLVIVHEWNSPELTRKVAACHGRAEFVLLFHDTHHRMVTDHAAISLDDLRTFDGVLAYGRSLRDRYVERGLPGERVWVWHEAADIRVFHPIPGAPMEGDLVWIGNWGDNERAAELREFLIEPAGALGLKTAAHGVRYPEEARAALDDADIDYRGWIANFDAPRVFAGFQFTVHIPRGPYVAALPGIPTIRPFEALACGIPLICSPWQDTEGLFTAGADYLQVRDGAGMRKAMAALRASRALRADLAAHGLQTVRARHTCGHRVDELLEICGKALRNRRRKPLGASVFTTP